MPETKEKRRKYRKNSNNTLYIYRYTYLPGLIYVDRLVELEWPSLPLRVHQPLLVGLTWAFSCATLVDLGLCDSKEKS